MDLRRLRALTDNEFEAMLLVAAEDLSNVELADRLSITVGSAESLVHRIYTKLGISGRRSLRREAIRAGVIEIVLHPEVRQAEASNDRFRRGKS